MPAPMLARRQADTGIVASQEAASGRADSQPADAAANSSDTDADASRPEDTVVHVHLMTWSTASLRVVFVGARACAVASKPARRAQKMKESDSAKALPKPG